ncbi:ROK family protein [Clostridium botulinum]|uniref:ROK family protein n=1 Tax=Clostridium botulinum TaxID=1491 RepID=UPI00052D8041|nr:ROK family protein [Clostridium botulinum]KGM97586.1 N-acetylmannosamine kinase [Clostridium botulinum D str. CCUG 7971]KOC50988.1 N-acetylmannosamine kinase [Clostridium botulinum]NFO96878.1 ROK family protein [Clostridium botulinum]OOV52771.1 N-acetylmannosamine kinase [Clostridium botulinum D/C]OOV57350.1 N-acetylmannosamine kinase [Clostridium botulinum D/C]
MKYLGIDIGGTEIKYGIVDDNGNIERSYSKETAAFKGADNLINNIEDIIQNIIKIEKINGIGISTAGQVNRNNGEIIFATNTIPGWTGVKLKKIIEDRFKIQCYVDNDVNCACLGYMWKSMKEDYKDFIFLTLGTGIGGAIVINGQLYTGSHFIAGEFGHMTICKAGEECTCGSKGCFERYASTSALIRRAKKQLKLPEGFKISGKYIFDKAKNNEKEYINVINEWSYDVAIGIKNIVHMFNPSLIVIGGGVSAQGDYLIKFIQKHMNKIIMPSFLKGLVIKTSPSGNKAGMLGAIYGLKML